MAYTVKYYDLVLAGVLASLLAGVAAGWLTALSMAATVPVFAVLGAAIIGHGLFVNGPVDQPADLAERVDALD